MNRKIIICVLAVSVLMFLAGSVAFASVNELAGKIAFLRDGEICLSNTEGGEIELLTQTEGKVRDFRFSPGLEYLAYTKVVGMVEGVGYYEEGEEVPKTETWSIVVVELPTMNVLIEIEPEHDWLNLVQWTAFDKLMYYLSSGYDVGGFSQYKVGDSEPTRFEPDEGYRMFRAEFSSDRTMMSYVDYTGLGESSTDRLHLVKQLTAEDKVVATKKRIRDHSPSHDGRYAAFTEIQTADSEKVAALWIYDSEGDKLEQQAILPAKTAGNSTMSWSVSDSCIGVFWSPSNSLNGYIVPLHDPTDIHEISGKQFCWASDRLILYSRHAADIYLYDLDAREEKLLIEGATNPVFLIRSE